MNIYVSNLDYEVADDDLRGFFEDYGQVDSARVIMDRETRRSRGFGFVEMNDDDAAEKAVKELNGAHVKGRAINVAVAKEREEKPQRSFAGRRY
ncbi:MAG: RNA-binding protein [Chitinophagaceae bacterium]